MSVLPIPCDVDIKFLHPKVHELFKKKQWIQRTPEWYEVRKGLMTASDASGALGVPPFKSFKGNPREELLTKKLNNAPVQGMALQHGVKYESDAAELAMEILGERMFEFGLLVHNEYDWLAASPDGITARGFAVEIKCPMRRKIIPGEVPHHYLPQIQVQLEVCDLEFCYFIQYKPGFMNDDGNPFIDIVVVERDRRWFSENRDLLYGFWSELMDRRISHIPEEVKSDVVNNIEDDLYEKSTLVYEREFETVPDVFYKPDTEVCMISSDLYI
jgi:putative phage-type endonuclease